MHPFLGVGVEGVRETERLDAGFVPIRGPVAPTAEPGRRVAYQARPFVTGGVKFYVSERGFIRTDLRTTFSPSGAESAVWRAGVGVDF